MNYSYQLECPLTCKIDPTLPSKTNKYAVNLKVYLHLLILFSYLPHTTTALTLFVQRSPIALQLLIPRDT